MTKGEEVLRLRSLGLSNKQIAEAMHMPVPSVRRLASEAKAAKAEPMRHSEQCVTRDYRACRCYSEAKGELPTLDEELVAKLEQYSRDRIQEHLVNEALQEWAAGFKYNPEPQRKAKHVVIPDTQVRPGVPTEHVLWAGKYIADQQPDVVVHLGDHWDLPSLSSYEKAGSKWFDGRTLRADIDAGNDALSLLMEGMGDFRPRRLVMLRGNHEDRLTRAINDDPVKLEGLVGFQDFNDVRLGWEVVDYQVPIEIDDLSYCHYFYNPANGRPYGGNVDTMLRNIGGSFVMGHRQGLSVGRRELPNGRTQRGIVAGSFYQHCEEYRGPQAAFEWRGILVLHEVANGNFDLMEVSMNYLRNRYGKESN